MLFAASGALLVLTTEAGLARAQSVSQTQADVPSTFEVATLKQVPPNAPAPMSVYPGRHGDRFVWCNRLEAMLSYAYNVPWTRIEGYRDDGHLYSLDSKIDPSATGEQARQMLRALLVERLKLTVHLETREVEGDALVIAKNGPKLQEADASGQPPPMPNDMKDKPVTAYKGLILTYVHDDLEIEGRAVTTAQLAEELSKNLKATVVDHTGLTGKYYIDMKYQPEGAQTSADPNGLALAEDIFTALSDQLGLKIEKAKVPAEFLVVQHFEKPTDNQN